MEVSSMNEEQARALRAPFEASLVGKLPRVTCKDCSKKQCSRQDHKWVKCRECHAYTSPQHIHLDYVGHAETTDRFLSVDPEWSWEPFALTPDGLPKFDGYGGLWMRVTICGTTKIGYGDAGDKTGPNAIKEVIGDGLRNAGIRFGVALDLWAKSDLASQFADKETGEIGTGPTHLGERWWEEWSRLVRGAKDLDTLKGLRAEAWARKKGGQLADDQWAAADELTKSRKAELETPAETPTPDPSPAPGGEPSETTPDGASTIDSAPSGAATSSPPAAPVPIKLTADPQGSNGMRKALLDGLKSALSSRGIDVDTYLTQRVADGATWDRIATSDLRKLSSELAMQTAQQVPA